MEEKIFKLIGITLFPLSDGSVAMSYEPVAYYLRREDAENALTKGCMDWNREKIYQFAAILAVRTSRFFADDHVSYSDIDVYMYSALKNIFVTVNVKELSGLALKMENLILHNRERTFVSADKVK